MTSIALIEFPTNLGLKQLGADKEPGVKKLPAWLKQYGFHELLAPQALYSLAPTGAYTMQIDPETGVLHADAVKEYAGQQAQLLTKILTTEAFPVVLGGDCSILIGNAVALKQRGNYALFYLDGHTDFSWPGLSQTGATAGMDVAIVTGTGHDKLANIKSLKPYFQEANVWCVGNRDYDEDYIQAIHNSEINYFDINNLRETGPSKIVADFLTRVADLDIAGFWIHLDVDVLHNSLMPAVDSPQPDGLWYDELTPMLYALLQHPKAAGLQITILDPDLDPDGQYTREFVSQVGNTIKKALAERTLPL